MCGIAGVVGTDDQSYLRGMTSALRHRGPDAEGLYSLGPFHLGSARLSIIDPSAGAQPVFNESGNIAVVLNGEIYNHRTLRSSLERRGHRFTTSTDTEVLVHLYEEEGIDFVQHLQGMFAFALLDGSRLILARDRLGIKPLFYSFPPRGNLFFFASEIKALLRCPEVEPELNLQALANNVVLTHPVGGETFFEGIHSLPCGNSMIVHLGHQVLVDAPKPFFALECHRDQQMNFEDALSALDNALTQAVESHLSADVEIGVTLSGGLDSTILAMLASHHAEYPLSTFAIGDHKAHPDLEQAALISGMIGSNHQTVVLTFDQYLATIPNLIGAEEQPSSLLGLPFYYLCTQIAHQLKVCLHGEGADELFGGYTDFLDRYSRITHIRERLPILKRLGIAPCGRAIHIAEQLASGTTFDQYLTNLFDLNMREPLERHHLTPVDRYAMASGIEMRVPYLDNGLIDLVTRMPIRFLVRPDLGIRKYILRHFALKRFGSQMADVVLREKLGAPSAGTHFLMRFDRLCNELLPDSYVKKHDFGFCFPNKRRLLLFDLFLEIFMRRRGKYSEVGNVMDFIQERSTSTRLASLAT